MRKTLGFFILFLGIIPFFGFSAFGGGGMGAPLSFEVLAVDSGLIIQEIDKNGNSVFMQHVLTNDYGIAIDVTVSSYNSTHFPKIDETCESMTLFTNHILVIPYHPVPISELGRYVMLPALAEFTHPDTLENSEIHLEKYSLLLDGAQNLEFTK